jgi:tRNA (guanine37-N1)-methyltransferase
MKVDIITIFPLAFAGYLNESILKRAQKKKLLAIRVHDLRRWTTDRHRTVDDRPYGGGPGMVMKVEPFYRAVAALKRKAKSVTAERDPVRGKKRPHPVAQAARSRLVGIGTTGRGRQAKSL